MPIDSVHPDYAAAQERWKRNRAVVSGEDAVKAAGETYLPKLGGQNDADYKKYLTRATFFNATGRTADGLAGLVFRKAPVAELPAVIKAYAEDVDFAGTSLDDFARKAFEDALKTGRGGILTEYPSGLREDVVVQNAEAEGLRPYLVYYPAEKIYDWDVGRVNNRTVLTYLKLFAETWEPNPDDEWTRVQVKRMRVYRLLAEGVTLEVYKWQKVKSGTMEWLLEAGPFPILMAGKPAKAIPFQFIPSIDVSKGPLDDIALTNLSHYRTSADYENALHWCGVPTPIFCGQMTGPDGKPVTEVCLGSSSGINLSADGSASMLQAEMEPGLGEALKRKEDYMAVLGMRILASEKRAVETAETAGIHRAGENSVLANFANMVSGALSKALTVMCQFKGSEEVASYTLNTDYLPTGADPQMITAIKDLWKEGLVSWDIAIEELKHREVIRADVDAKKMREAIDDEQGKADDAAGAALMAEVERMKAEQAAQEKQGQPATKAPVE
jgi:hypothetical protein